MAQGEETQHSDANGTCEQTHTTYYWNKDLQKYFVDGSAWCTHACAQTGPHTSCDCGQEHKPYYSGGGPLG